VLVHLSNCLLLFAIVRRVSKNFRIAFLGALIYSALPLYSVAVFWPGDADFQLTFFYLLAIYSWVRFLQDESRAFQILAFVFFLLALTTKEFGVTIPAALFLIDRFVLRDHAKPGALVRRYLPFALVSAVYLPMEYFIQSRSVLTNQFGYGLGDHVLSNLFGYLAALAFPWGLPEPINYAWLFLAAILILARKNSALLATVCIGVLAFLPVILFPWFLLRYLYSAVMVPAIFIAYLFDYASKRFSARWFAFAASIAMALVVFGNSWGMGDAAADFAELGRQTRVPFRDITQRHATFPDDTYLYFIHPPSPTSEYSGMFFIRYGPRISVASNEYETRRANLRDHLAAYVIYFDEERRTREIAVQRNLAAQSDPKSLLDFSKLGLEDLELANDRAKPGEAIALILYWSRAAPGARRRVQLVESATASTIASAETRPESYADAIILSIPRDAHTGKYRVEIPVSDSAQIFLIEPITVE
jgi:hypothetical protein